jgi:hypothetical protein
MRLGGLDKLKTKWIPLIGSRTRDLPDCNVVPQTLRHGVPRNKDCTVRIGKTEQWSKFFVICLIFSFHLFPSICWKFSCHFLRSFILLFTTFDRLCGLVVRVPGYRSGGLGFDSRALQEEEKSGGSGTRSSQPREYKWGATWKKK